MNIQAQQRVFVFRLSYGIWLMLGAAFQVGMTYQLLRIPPIFDPLLWVVGSGTYITYNIAKLQQIWQIGLQKGLKCPKQVLVYSFIDIALFGVAVGIATYNFFDLKLTEQLWICLSAFIAIGYSIPLFSIKNVIYVSSFRQMGILKTHFVALIWAIGTALLPAIHVGEPPSSLALWIIFFMRYLFVFALTLPFEIRDMEQDKNIGVQTLPLRIGIRRTIRIGQICLILATFIALSHYLFLSFRPFVCTVLLMSFGVCAYFANKALQYKSLWYYTFALDGLLVWQAVGLLLCPR